MNEYEIEIVETLRQVVKVKALNEKDALKDVKRMYYDGEVILFNDEDREGARFTLLKK